MGNTDNQQNQPEVQLELDGAGPGTTRKTAVATDDGSRECSFCREHPGRYSAFDASELMRGHRRHLATICETCVEAKGTLLEQLENARDADRKISCVRFWDWPVFYAVDETLKKFKMSSHPSMVSDVRQLELIFSGVSDPRVIDEVRQCSFCGVEQLMCETPVLRSSFANAAICEQCVFALGKAPPAD